MFYVNLLHFTSSARRLRRCLVSRKTVTQQAIMLYIILYYQQTVTQ